MADVNTTVEPEDAHRSETAPTAADPGLSLYLALHRAFHYFNEHLFEKSLPPCLITLQRSRVARGTFDPARFEARFGDGSIDELSLNPDAFLNRTDREILSTLVHEQVHLWQRYFGAPSKAVAHNREWVVKMESIGLIPSSTGAPGGKQTGPRVSHYIQPNGPFDIACTALLAGDFQLSWQSLVRPRPMRTTRRPMRFRCPVCRQSAVGRDGNLLACGRCDVDMVPDDRVDVI